MTMFSANKSLYRSTRNYSTLPQLQKIDTGSITPSLQIANPSILRRVVDGLLGIVSAVDLGGTAIQAYHEARDFADYAFDRLLEHDLRAGGRARMRSRLFEGDPTVDGDY